MPEKPPTNDDPLISLAQAAAYLGVSPKSLRALSGSGAIVYYVPGPEQVRRKFRKSDLDRYLEGCRVEAPRPRVESLRARLVGRPDGRPQRWD
jgi:excisionase family DNA binding protein